MELEGNKKNIEVERPVEPPFPALCSFHIAALVISYRFYDNDVAPFLMRLSKKAGEYFEKHEDLIKVFLKSGSKLTSSLDFGSDNTEEWTNEYPTQEQFIQ